MTGPCVNNDGADTANGRLLCGDCEKRLLDVLALIGEDAMPLLLVATKRASVSMVGNGHTAPAQAPSPLRDGMTAAPAGLAVRLCEGRGSARHREGAGERRHHGSDTVAIQW